MINGPLGGTLSYFNAIFPNRLANGLFRYAQRLSHLNAVGQSLARSEDSHVCAVLPLTWSQATYLTPQACN